MQDRYRAYAAALSARAAPGRLLCVLRERIDSGEIAPDEPLPSITRIRQETGLAVGTIRQGIAQLVEEGYAYVVPGRGTFAKENRSSDDV
jgi:GntR family transcriptional regulator